MRGSSEYRSSTWSLHTKNAESSFFLRRVHSRRDAEGENHSRIGRIDDSIIPQPRGAVVRIAFLFILIEDGLLEFFLFCGRHGFGLRFQLIYFHLEQYTRRLLSTHD